MKVHLPLLSAETVVLLGHEGQQSSIRNQKKLVKNSHAKHNQKCLPGKPAALNFAAAVPAAGLMLTGLMWEEILLEL